MRGIENEAREFIEHHLRLQRTGRGDDRCSPSADRRRIEAFHRANLHSFLGSALFEAAHIVKHLDGGQNEVAARAEVENASAELENGVPFP